MIKPNAISASITKKRCISCAILWIMHIPVTIHLKPVNVSLFGQTKNTSHRGKNNNSLFQLVKTELHWIINHTIIADTAFIYICVAFIIWNVIPHRCLVLWFDRPYIQAGKIRGRGYIFLCSNILYDDHHTGKCQQILSHFFILVR